MKYTVQMIDPAENIMMLESKNNDGRIPHSHEFVELVYVQSGKGLHNTQGKSYAVSAGDLFILHTQDEHSLVPLGQGEAQEKFRWVNCLFLPGFIDFDLAIFPHGSTYVGTEGFETGYMFQAMVREYEHKAPGYLDVLRSYLRIILVRLARRLQEGEEDAQSYAGRKMNNDLKKAIDYIHAHCQDKLSLTLLAAELGTSPSYIGRLFRELKDTSPMAYANHYRIERSCLLLQQTALPVQHIAEQLGIRDPKFFYRLFKRTMGMTPGEFREKYGQ